VFTCEVILVSPSGKHVLNGSDPNAETHYMSKEDKID
jgi:hypothetical protein